MTLTVESWCEALESGKYEKAAGELRDGGSNKFCCLGVACDLSGIGRWTPTGNYDADGQSCGVDLPFVVEDLLGLKTEDGQFDLGNLSSDLRAELAPFIHTGRISLASINDEGAPFLLIAKVIRARPTGLFR